jgi:hypothetical protein
MGVPRCDRSTIDLDLLFNRTGQHVLIQLQLHFGQTAPIRLKTSFGAACRRSRPPQPRRQRTEAQGWRWITLTHVLKLIAEVSTVT